MDKHDWYIHTMKYYITMRIKVFLYYITNKSYKQPEQKKPDAKENELLI